MFVLPHITRPSPQKRKKKEHARFTTPTARTTTDTTPSVCCAVPQLCRVEPARVARLLERAFARYLNRLVVHRQVTLMSFATTSIMHLLLPAA